MSDGESPRPYDDLARRWRALAERRRQHIVELYHSGRWRHYYIEQTLVEGLREATRCVEQWDAILESRPRDVPTPVPEPPPPDATPAEADAPLPSATIELLINILQDSAPAHGVPHSDAA